LTKGRQRMLDVLGLVDRAPKPELSRQDGSTAIIARYTPNDARY
jgi:hypothetical protein